MLTKKMKLISSVVVTTAPFIACSTIAAAANTTSSDFMIKLFNNTSQTQPLHYYVKSDNTKVVEGTLLKGDNQGKSIKITSNSADKTSAEVIVTDSTGHLIWDGTVSYWGKASEFYTKTVSLDSHYSVGTHPFPDIHSITYDIQS